MRAIALCGALFALGGAVAAVATSGADAAPRTAKPAAAPPRGDDPVVAQIQRLQRTTWHWQSLLGLKRSGSSFAPARSTDPAYRVWVRDLWRRRATHLRRSAERYMARRIVTLQAEVDHWRRVMGKPPLRQTAAAATREQAYVTWRRLAHSVLREASNPPYASAWRCIHRYEGSWTDAGGPYYGGLQMDLGFQRHYGGYLLATKGTADRWTPLEQMWVAARAYRSGRGFYPWPNTARACGLI
jgi:hypothetical protein